MSEETHDEKKVRSNLKVPHRRSVKESGGHHSRTEHCAAVIDCPEQDADSMATSGSVCNWHLPFTAVLDAPSQDQIRG